MNNKNKTTNNVVRVNGVLKEITTVFNEAGEVAHKITQPLMVEFYPRDLMQVIVGSVLLAIPVGFTQEVWDLGETMPMANTFLFMFVSICFIGIFVYSNFYRRHFHEHQFEFIKRVVAIYISSFIVAGVFLILIDKAPWSIDATLAFKRTILVAFPASLSATLADMVK